jgi:hypothetical protein
LSSKEAPVIIFNPFGKLKSIFVLIPWHRIAIDVVIDNLVWIRIVIRHNFIAESRMENEVSMPIKVPLSKLFSYYIIQIGIYGLFRFQVIGDDNFTSASQSSVIFGK